MGYQLSIIFGFLIAGGLALFIILIFGKLIRPAKPDAEKASTYECGERPFGPAWFNFNNRFYVIALVFVVFDVEVALVFPTVLLFRKLVDAGLGWFVFAEIFFFLGVLILGLVYFWLKRDFRWVQEISTPTNLKPDQHGKENDR